jgi:hypothetical protein
MAKHTPIIENGQLTVEAIGKAEPRIQRFLESLFEHLRALEVEITTTTTYLLNSTQHLIEVPSAVNHVPVRVEFAASVPEVGRPRIRLQLQFNGGKRRWFFESTRHGQGFPSRRIMKVFIAEIQAGQTAMVEFQDQKRKADKAKARFSGLAENLGVRLDPTDPGNLRLGALRIRRLLDTPSKVVVALVVTHEQALEISRKYGNHQDS